ncbi:MAG: glycosyltransferase [Spirochaetota bacterium]
MQIVQHIDEFQTEDGIGNDILGIQECLNQLGMKNFIVSRKNKSKKKIEKIQNLSQLDTSETMHILHYGGRGYPINSFLALQGKKVLRFHNITPVHLYSGKVSDAMLYSIEKESSYAKMELLQLAEGCDFFLFDSFYNLECFSDMVPCTITKQNSFVLPIVRKYATHKKSANIHTHTITFIGRVVPSKNIEGLLYTLYYLQQINPRYCLDLIGKKNVAFEKYTSYLEELIQDLQLGSSVNWNIEITDEQVTNKLQQSDIYLSLSKHEGFCIPLLESFACGALSFFYGITATPETARGAGIVIAEENYEEIAALIDICNSNYQIKNRVLEKQYNVVKYYNSIDHGALLKSILTHIHGH